MNALSLPAPSPQLLLTVSLLGTLSLGMRRDRPALARAVAALGLLAGLALLVRGNPLGMVGDLWRQDAPARLWQCLFFTGALPLILALRARSEIPVGLILGAVLGMAVLASANHLFLMFLGLELMSLPTYALIYRLRLDARSLEASIKYFFNGSMAAAFFLFGLSIYYALRGTMTLSPLPQGPALELAMVFMGSAALFKVGAFPMHFWLPDAYEAAPPELSGFMSTAIKAAGFLLLARLVWILPETSYFLWLLPAVSAATMTVGNLLALRQQNVQRLLAYSSISHVGYLLAALWAGARLSPRDMSGIYLYLAVYLFMNTGVFLFLRVTGVSKVHELRGLAARSPGLAAFWALMLLSLAGVPPTGGFLAKFFVVVDLLRVGGVGLAVVLALNSLVGLGYYFRLIRAAFLEPAEPEDAAETPPAPWAAGWVLAACALVSLLAGLWPGIRPWLQALLGSEV